MIHHRGPGVLNMTSISQGRNVSICWVPADLMLQLHCSRNSDGVAAGHTILGQCYSFIRHLLEVRLISWGITVPSYTAPSWDGMPVWFVLFSNAYLVCFNSCECTNPRNISIVILSIHFFKHCFSDYSINKQIPQISTFIYFSPQIFVNGTW